jgi:hypothetical protein
MIYKLNIALKAWKMNYFKVSSLVTGIKTRGDQTNAFVKTTPLQSSMPNFAINVSDITWPLRINRQSSLQSTRDHRKNAVFRSQRVINSYIYTSPFRHETPFWIQTSRVQSLNSKQPYPPPTQSSLHLSFYPADVSGNPKPCFKVIKTGWKLQ